MDWRRIPSLSALRAFEAQARLGGFSAAARELNVTQAAIAQHVRALEAHFGTDLVTRAGRGMALTATGQQLAATLVEGFGAIEAGVAALLDADAARPLVVSLTPAFAENWLMPRLGGFWAAHPDIELALRPSTALVDLRRDGIDLAIRYGAGDWPGVESTPLVTPDFVVVGAPALLAGRDRPEPAALTDLRWLIETGFTEQALWAEAFGLDFDAMDIVTLDTNTLVLSATRAGHGVSIHPRVVVERDIAEGRLVAAGATAGAGPGYHLVTRPGPPAPRLRALIGWLKRSAGAPRCDADGAPAPV